MFSVACTHNLAPIVTQSSRRSKRTRIDDPPKYLAPYARSPSSSRAADLLLDGESVTAELFGVWDVEVFGSKILLVDVPQGDFKPEIWPNDGEGWPVVRGASPLRTSDRIVVYDSRAVVAHQDGERNFPADDRAHQHAPVREL